MDSHSDNLISLLIVDKSLHQAEVITSALRSAGVHVLAEFAEDSSEMCEIILHKSMDLIIFSLDLPDFQLHQVQHLLHECGRHLSIICITKDIHETLVVTAMKNGAQDVVKTDDLEHLSMAIKREFTSLRNWRKSVNNDKELHESEKRCQSLLANSKDAVAYVHEGMHIYANEPYMELFGNADLDELEATPLIDMVDSSQQDTHKKYLRDLAQNKATTNELTLKLIHTSGEIIEGVLEFSRASYDGERCTQILIRSQADTSELEKQINYLHQHDMVTGLYNRQFFMETLKTSIDEAINEHRHAVMIYISIDNFQSVRDTVGISGCDILIDDIAQILKEFFHKDDLLARFAAYSYSLISKSKSKAEIEKLVAEALVKIEQNICEVGNKSISATCSLVIYNIDQNSPVSSNEIISRVERTIDRIQNEGGNRVQTYVPAAGEMTLEEEDGEILKQIKQAIANHAIDAKYQPIVNIGEGVGERYEISRILHSTGGGVMDQKDYLPAAERTGIAKTLDRWSIIHAIKIISKEVKSGRKLNVFIPLTADSILDASLPRWVAARIKSAKIPGEQLVFTINESHAVNQLKAAKTLFKSLKQLHCQIVLDDFGTGLNPFQLLKHIQADYLRINIAFVDGLAANVENQNSIREITNQASSMEVRCIIPGVSDAGVLSVIWSVGADFVQGDFLQAPANTLNYDFSSMSG